MDFPYKHMTWKVCGNKVATNGSVLWQPQRRVSRAGGLCSSTKHLVEIQHKNMPEYHDLYLLSDVLLLADVFEHFQQTVFSEHKLDCLHFITLPSLAWAMALKHTKAQSQLTTNPDMYLMKENYVRWNSHYIHNGTHQQTILMWQAAITLNLLITSRTWMLIRYTLLPSQQFQISQWQ